MLGSVANVHHAAPETICKHFIPEKSPFPTRFFGKLDWHEGCSGGSQPFSTGFAGRLGKRSDGAWFIHARETAQGKRNRQMSVLRYSLFLSAAVALGSPLMAKAASQDAASPFSPFSEMNQAMAQIENAPDSTSAALPTQNDSTTALEQSLLLDAAPPAPEQPNIHELLFFALQDGLSYVTPRGLVVQNEGLVWQPVIGLVFLPIGDSGAGQAFHVRGRHLEQHGHRRTRSLRRTLG